MKISQAGNSNAKITKMTILDGSCGNLIPMMETNLIATDGTLELTLDGLNNGQNCFIQLERETTANSNFSLSIKKENEPPTLDKQKSVIIGKPMFTQGYLVFDKEKYNVDRWQIRFVKKSYTEDSNKSTRFITTTEILETKELPIGTNYIFIPYEYRGQSYSKNYLVDVRGLNSSGKTVVEERNVQLNDENGGLDIIQACGGCISYLPNCSVVCNDPTVAYRIQQFKRQNVNLSRFEVKDAFTNFDPNSNTANPLYWYIEMDKFNAPGNQCVSIGMGCNVFQPINGNLIGPFNANNVTYRDPAGNVLSGNVIGIKKTRGKWGAKNYIDTDNNFTIGDEFCNYTIQQGVSLINANGNFLTPQGILIDDLECINNDNLVGNTEPIGGNATSCFDITDFQDFPTETPRDFFDDFFTNTLNCLCENTGGGSSGICDNPDIGGTVGLPTNLPWFELMDRVIISELNNTTKEPIIIKTSELFASNNGNGNNNSSGWFKGLSLTLEPGLYSFGMAFKNGEYRRRILEIKTTLVATTQLASLIDIAIFSNPIVGKKYNLSLQAKAKLHFDYEVRDFMGNVVYRKNLNINKNEDKIIQINNAKLPSGILFHRFIFDDGSYQSIETLKN